MAGKMRNFTVTVAISTTVSGKFGVGDYERGSVEIPAAFTGTNLDFEVSNDGSTWDAVRDDSGSAVGAQTVAVDQVHNIPANVFKAQFARLLVDSQAAARTVTVFLAGN